MEHLQQHQPPVAPPGPVPAAAGQPSDDESAPIPGSHAEAIRQADEDHASPLFQEQAEEEEEDVRLDSASGDGLEDAPDSSVAAVPSEPSSSLNDADFVLQTEDPPGIFPGHPDEMTTRALCWECGALADAHCEVEGCHRPCCRELHLETCFHCSGEFCEAHLHPPVAKHNCRGFLNPENDDCLLG